MLVLLVELLQKCHRMLIVFKCRCRVVLMVFCLLTLKAAVGFVAGNVGVHSALVYATE